MHFPRDEPEGELGSGETIDSSSVRMSEPPERPADRPRFNMYECYDLLSFCFTRLRGIVARGHRLH